NRERTDMPIEVQLSTDELLSTTRTVRKRLDFQRPVPLEVVRECLELAIQAPTGSNSQGWQWVVVTDPGKRRELGELYRKGFQAYAAAAHYPGRRDTGDPDADAVGKRVASS